MQPWLCRLMQYNKLGKNHARTYKINLDGAFKEGKGGVGILVRDFQGNVIAAASIPIENLTGRC